MLVPNERRGEFYYPDGTPIPTRGDAGSDGLFRGRGHQFIVLQRMPTATTTPPIGRYHCIIPGNRFNVSFNFSELITMNSRLDIESLSVLTSSLAIFLHRIF